MSLKMLEFYVSVLSSDWLDSSSFSKCIVKGEKEQSTVHVQVI